jgi:type I restriction enzyme S subunit
MKHSWEKIKLGNILKYREGLPNAEKFASGDIPIISKISFDDGKIGLRNDGITNTKLVRVLPNDLVISGINAEKGAISINDFGKEITATIHYSAYYPINEQTDLKYIYYYLKSAVFKDYLKFKLANGIKTELKPKRFLNLSIPLPSIHEQKNIVSKIEDVKTKLKLIKELRAEQTKDINNLLFSKYTQMIEDAEWLPMKEVAPIHRRQVEIKPDEIYFEIGVRSFGRGLFEKPSFQGIDLTWQQPFWMKEGDLLFSNIKAWEGAVGLIPKQYDGWVGSHRYITCLPNLKIINPEFLYYYFKIQEGVDKLSLASPGTVDRNRTLNTKMLSQILVPVPDITLQEEFVKLLHKVSAIKNHHNETEQELNELMPSLLDKAFKGEL